MASFKAHYSRFPLSPSRVWGPATNLGLGSVFLEGSCILVPSLPQIFLYNVADSLYWLVWASQEPLFVSGSGNHRSYLSLLIRLKATWPVSRNSFSL